jgi:predicted methyltransferase
MLRANLLATAAAIGISIVPWVSPAFAQSPAAGPKRGTSDRFMLKFVKP